MDRGAWRATGHGIAESQTLIDLGHTLWSFFFSTLWSFDACL